jgi:hypothetical protein
MVNVVVRLIIGKSQAKAWGYKVVVFGIYLQPQAKAWGYNFFAPGFNLGYGKWLQTFGPTAHLVFHHIQWHVAIFQDFIMEIRQFELRS